MPLNDPPGAARAGARCPAPIPRCGHKKRPPSWRRRRCRKGAFLFE
ncbi:hypothetical protein L21SP2_2743 [Salinispira pacifica]|uniref:Uncharacterized protein n=1 Tax=Salinispira pacifica TaxID=1307761 RepID=V5WK26_9SPIO|nr:hypothetical protein L21SP2_2743 [Salinispira pacifica]